MPRIREYEQQYRPGGEVGGRRAAGQDFGIADESMGAGMVAAGHAMQSAADALYKVEENREIADAQVKVAQQRTEATKRFYNNLNNIKPGDDTYITQFQDEQRAALDELKTGYKTAGAQKYVSYHGEVLVNDFATKAYNYQLQETRQEAKALHENRVAADAQTVYADPSQFDRVSQELTKEFEAGVGRYEIFRNQPEQGKQQLRQDVEKMAWNAAMKVAETPGLRAEYMYLVPKAALSDQELGKRYDEMVKAGATAEQLAAFVKENRQNAAVEVDGVKYSPEALPERGMPTWFNAMTPDKKVAFINYMERYAKQDASVAAHAQLALIKDQTKYVEVTGQPIQNPLPRTAFASEREWQGYSALVQASNLIGPISAMPADKQQAEIDKLRPTAADVGVAYEQKAAVYEHAVKMLDAHNKQRANDPIGTAINGRFAKGSSPLQPMTADNPTMWAEQLAIRAPQAKAISETGGTPERMLSRDEAAQMGARLNMMTTADWKTTVQSIAKRNGSDVAIQFFKEAMPGSQSTLVASRLLTLPEAYTQGGYDASQVATTMHEGARLIENNLKRSAGNAEERANSRTLMPSDADVARMVAKRLEGVASLGQNEINAYTEATKAYYVGRQNRNGIIDMDITKKGSSGNAKTFEEAMDIVIGKPTKVGGSAVVRPWGMSEATFLDGVSQRVKEVSDGKIAEGSYGLIHLRDNQYQVVVGGIAQAAIDMDKPTSYYRPEGRHLAPKPVGMKLAPSGQMEPAAGIYADTSISGMADEIKKAAGVIGKVVDAYVSFGENKDKDKP